MNISVCGDVIVTDLAIIVVAPDPTKTKALQTGASMAGHIAGGAMGGALAAGYARSSSNSLLNLGDAEPVPPLAHMSRVVSCWPSEVPAELSGLEGWPKLAEVRALTFYPRGVIGEVKLSFTGEMTLTLPGVGPDVKTGVNFWQVGKAKSHLKNAGYRLS
jgi:hypothetical protein